jgi:hypothetical protein
MVELVYLQGQDVKAAPSMAPPVIATAGFGAVNFHALRIALVDDEPANQRVAARFLKGLGVDPDNILILSDGMCGYSLGRLVFFPLSFWCFVLWRRG